MCSTTGMLCLRTTHALTQWGLENHCSKKSRHKQVLHWANPYLCDGWRQHEDGTNKTQPGFRKWGDLPTRANTLFSKNRRDNTIRVSKFIKKMMVQAYAVATIHPV
uniref:Uncharacterized protein n=1 Tax=Eutreptiella gymnastica TaxID=73025 RepID=A0A7S4CGB2_9EUGL|mmetsp:Transcript_83550/g.139462  ORF Transcript_83550/g.139462 Transcript_83550/m.139462 type:complete len:106 (+) Transcript_83550:143-460(+)